MLAYVRAPVSVAVPRRGLRHDELVEAHDPLILEHQNFCTRVDLQRCLPYHHGAARIVQILEAAVLLNRFAALCNHGDVAHAAAVLGVIALRYGSDTYQRIGADVDKDVVEAVWIVLTPNPRPRFIIIRLMPLLEKTAQIPHDAQASVRLRSYLPLFSPLVSVIMIRVVIW